MMYESTRCDAEIVRTAFPYTHLHFYQLCAWAFCACRRDYTPRLPHLLHPSPLASTVIMSCLLLRPSVLLLFLLVWLWRSITGVLSARRNGLLPRATHNPAVMAAIGTLTFTAAVGATTAATSWGQDAAPTTAPLERRQGNATVKGDDEGF